jgi:NADH:ubiquinone oxidoreductase subunit E
MSTPRDRQARTAALLVKVSAAVGVICILFLVVDYGIALGRSGAERERVTELEAAVKADPEIAQALHDERERQTLASMARDARGRVAAWVLLVAAGTFIACGKWYLSFQPQQLPVLEDLVAARFAPTVPANGSSPRASPAVPPAADEAADLSFVDDLVARFGRSREAAIPILQAIQSHYRYLPDEALQRVCEISDITPAQIAGTSSFYAQFRRSPVGRYVVRVCHGTACHVAGAEQVTQELHRHLEIPAGEDTDPKRMFTIDKVACLGCCSLAPVMMVEEETAGHLTPASARQVLDDVAART